MSEKAVTNGIQVEVESSFVPEHSDIPGRQFFFSYRIRIQNLSDKTVQLLSRHWIIIDGNGRTDEIKGPGVVGQQPELAPGGAFEYESFCPLETPAGTMSGSYEMLNSHNGERFQAEIPQFFLVEPNHYH